MKVLNFNDPYVDRKGDVNNLGDVLSDTSVDLTDYAKKTDIPATLPANGGNADTVNNHTVESDVPENAVFTDTIYDDTEVKGSIEELNRSLGVIGKCKNLLNPTKKTSTSKGITFTANGDGTYTLNGTCETGSIFYFELGNVEVPNKNLVLLGSKNVNVGIYISGKTNTAFGNTSIINDDVKGTKVGFGIAIRNGVICTNEIVKPMICENLNATYDDFVPYTGDGDTLTHDVAEIKNDLGDLSFSASGTALTITDGTNTWTLNANS